MNVQKAIILIAGCLMFMGCSGESIPETVEVSGTVKLNADHLKEFE